MTQLHFEKNKKMIYEYKCNHCNTTFEKFLTVSRINEKDYHTTKCIECGGTAKKIISTFNFKGKGLTPKFHKRVS